MTLPKPVQAKEVVVTQPEMYTYLLVSIQLKCSKSQNVTEFNKKYFEHFIEIHFGAQFDICISAMK